MKFSQTKLENLHKALKNLNNLDLGTLELPDRLGLFNKQTQEIEAIAVFRGGSYELELIQSEEIEAHDNEVNSSNQ